MMSQDLGVFTGNERQDRDPLRFTCCTVADSWDGPLGNGEFEDMIDLAFSIGFV